MNYICQLHHMYIHIFLPPLSVAPLNTAAPESVTAIQGDMAVFTCNATARPRPHITWWRVNVNGSLDIVNYEINKTIIESLPIGKERELISSLTILDVQPSDAGIYLCRAENRAGLASESAILTVHGKLQYNISNNGYYSTLISGIWCNVSCLICFSYFPFSHSKHRISTSKHPPL